MWTESPSLWRWTRVNSLLFSWAETSVFLCPSLSKFLIFKALKHWDSHTVAMAALGPHSSHWGIRLVSFSFPGLQVVIIPWAFSVSVSVWAHHHSKSHVSYQFFPLEYYVIYQLWFLIVPLVFSFLYRGWHNMQSSQAGFFPLTLYLRSIPHLYMAHFFLLLKDVPFKFDSTFFYWIHKVPLSWGDWESNCCKYSCVGFPEDIIFWLIWTNTCELIPESYGKIIFGSIVRFFF